MRTAVMLVGLLILTLTLGLAPAALGQKKPKEENANEADYKFLEKIKSLEGEITTLEPSTRQLTLKVGYAYLEPNPAYRPNKGANAAWTRRVNQCIHDVQKALTIRNPTHRIQRLQELSVRMQVLQAQAPTGPPPFRPAMAYKNVEAEAIDTVIVRRKDLPLEYDDKGNVKEYTEKEKKELRGPDPKLPGYTAKWEDVQSGQKVKLYLKTKKALEKEKKSLADRAAKAEAAKEKEASAGKEALDKDAAKPPAADADKKADKDNPPDLKAKDDAADMEPRVYAYMILIQADPDPTATPANKGKKRKKNNNN
jgi:hypothetical protein